MSQPHTVELPHPDQLRVDEIPVIGATLKATAIYLGKYCDDLSKEYMLCKREERDPRKCLNEGKDLTACGLEFYRKLKQTCRPEIEAYAQCIDKNSGIYPLNICPQNRVYFDDCMKNKFGIERPELGHFSQPRVHSSKRDKPNHQFNEQEILPGLPEDYEESIMKGKPPAEKKYTFFNFG